jgi:hypothetical protein
MFGGRSQHLNINERILPFWGARNSPAAETDWQVAVAIIFNRFAKDDMLKR